VASGESGSPHTEILYSSDTPIGHDALDLVEFDMESVTQVIRSFHDTKPDVWLARPEGYVGEGHLLRDSESIRLIAWCRSSSVIYATDGCNTCRHALPAPLTEMPEAELRDLAGRTQLPFSMLSRLTQTR